MSNILSRIHKVSDVVVNLEIPAIGVKNYPIWKNENEDDATLFNRADAYAAELIRRHDSGEPYAIGYRVRKDEQIHLVIRIIKNGKTFEKAIGIDDDFVELEDDKV